MQYVNLLSGRSINDIVKKRGNTGREQTAVAAPMILSVLLSRHPCQLMQSWSPNSIDIYSYWFWLPPKSGSLYQLKESIKKYFVRSRGVLLYILVVRKLKKGIAKVEIKVGPIPGVTPITHSLSWTHLMWQLGPEPITQLVGKGCNAHVKCI